MPDFVTPGEARSPFVNLIQQQWGIRRRESYFAKEHADLDASREDRVKSINY